MPQTITLSVPDSFFKPIQRAAEATGQPVEKVVLTALQASLPSLDGLAPEVSERLVELEGLDDAALARVMAETVPAAKQDALRALLLRNQAGELAGSDRARMESLQRAADLVMLRKARAAVLLRFRGKRIPTLAELSELTAGGG